MAYRRHGILWIQLGVSFSKLRYRCFRIEISAGPMYLSMLFASNAIGWHYPSAVERAVTSSTVAWRPANAIRSFEPLTTILLEDKGLKRYEEELLKGLQNKEAFNVAVTGYIASVVA